MSRFYFACVEAVSAAIFLIPLYYYLNKFRFRNKATTSAAFLFALYLCTVYAMAGLPNICYIRFDPKYNFIPFLYFFSDRSSLLNIFLFMPLGLFLPALRSKFLKFGPTVLFGFLMSAFIEFFQIFTRRATDINDLITNTFGTILGYFLGKLLLHFYPKLILTEDNNELNIICVSVIVVMFFMQPFLSAYIWNFLL